MADGPPGSIPVGSARFPACNFRRPAGRLCSGRTARETRMLPSSPHDQQAMDLVFSEIGNLIGGREVPASTGARFDKINPHDGSRLWVVARSDAEDVARAVATAKEAQPSWARLSPVGRGEILRSIATALLSIVTPSPGLSRARPASRSQMPAAKRRRPHRSASFTREKGSVSTGEPPRAGSRTSSP